MYSRANSRKSFKKDTSHNEAFQSDNPLNEPQIYIMNNKVLLSNNKLIDMCEQNGIVLKT